jgi:hypothetical protein
VIKGRGMFFFGFHLIKALYAAMDPVIDRLGKTFDHGPSRWAAFPDDFYAGRMNSLTHENLPLKLLSLMLAVRIIAGKLLENPGIWEQNAAVILTGV